MGAVDFRIGGRIFATLASVNQGYGNLMLTPEVQAGFLADAPELFLPVAGGWGRNGATHIRLAEADDCADLPQAFLQRIAILLVEARPRHHALAAPDRRQVAQRGQEPLP